MSAVATQEVIQDFDLDTIIASRTNPRSVFDPVYLQEVAATIKALGRVQQAIVLRPLPASRMEETAHLKPRPTHEIVFGECRFRASKLAGMRTIKGTSRDISDADVLLIQLIENMKRKDLSPLEEGAGFRRLMDETGKTAEEVGKSVQRSRAYVYGRTKLLDLGTETRAALREGKIEPSTALLVARIPSSQLQSKALKQILEGEYDYQEARNRPLSHRRAQELLQREYMVQLSKAVFDIKSVDLVPAAGACGVCPKRTGANPDLYEEVKSADVCTDPICFHKKEAAHSAALVKAAAAKGQTVIAGKEAQELRTNSYQEKLKGYRRLDSAEDSPTDQPLRKIIGAQMKVDGIKAILIEDPRRVGEFLECLPNETVLKLLKTVEAQAAAASQASAGEKAPKVSAGVQKLVDEKKAKAETKAKEQFEKEWRQELVHSSWKDLQPSSKDKNEVGSCFTLNVHRYLVLRAAKSLSGEDASAIAKLLDLGKVALGSAVVEFAKETARPDLLHLLIIAQEASGPNEHSYDRVANEGMLLVADLAYGKTRDQVIDEIKAEVKAKIWPKVSKKALSKTPPLAQPEHAGGEIAKGTKPTAKKAPAARAKLSAEEAISGIAAAMQGVERSASAPKGAVAPTEATKAKTQGQLALGFAIGQTVQVTSDSSKFGARLAMHKWCGKKGTITAKAGKAWDVTFKGRSGGICSFDEDEISLVEGVAA